MWGQFYFTIYTFHTSTENKNRLFECNRISAQIWNDCLEDAKQHHKKTGKWLTKTQLQKQTKRKYPIHSQSIQAVVHKYIQARDAAKKARNKGYDTRYPYKKKNDYNTKWAKDGFTIHENGKIELKLGICQGKRQQPITVHVKKIPVGQVKEIELIWDKKLRNKKYKEIQKQLAHCKKGSRKWRKLKCVFEKGTM